MRLLKFSILLFVISIAFLGEAHRILGIFSFQAKSHFVMFERLMRELAERGHQVDVVSHFPLKKSIPNYNDVVSLAGSSLNLVNNMTVDFVEGLTNARSMSYLVATLAGTDVCDLMNLPKFKNLIENPPNDPPYDLAIIEIFGASCYLAMGQHLKIPVVGVISSLMFPWANDLIANPDNPAYIPNAFSDFDGKMNFWQRVQNTLINFKTKWDFYQASEQQTDQIKKYIGPHTPSVREAERNVSLILVNSHYSLNGARPFTTAVVEVGGLHIDDREATLPNDLQNWLDQSEDGFVYVSLGSMLKIESLPRVTLSHLYASLAKLAPIRVLMKVAKPEELPAGLPSNVLTNPWVPQLGVLKHKNVRAFMAHGGLMGTQEAIYYGVPMIGVPFFGDQGQNINLYLRMNIAVILDYKTLTVEKLDAAFRAVLDDPSYMKAAKRMSALFRDRPMSALDTAVFWIEYVIRNGGKNLRSPAMDLTWWQVSLCDIYGFLLVAAGLAVCFMIVIIRKLIELIYSSRVETMKDSKKVK